MDDNLANWKVGVTVAMAKFVVEDKGKCDDEVYGVGNKRKNRAYFLLFTVDTIRTTPANVDVTLGQWAVVSFDSTDLNVRPDTVSTGFYRRCASPHVHVGSLSLAGFKTCQLKHELMMAADSAGVSFETAQLLFDSLANKAKPSDNTQAQSALEKSLSTLVRLARGDEPAWTTCALGCCVSENPTRRNGANARANKSAVAPQSTRRRLDESAFAPANRSRKAL